MRSVALMLIFATLVTACKSETRTPEAPVRVLPTTPTPPNGAPQARSDREGWSPQATGEDRIDWLVAGGGATPDSNQVQMEQDLALARRVLGGKRPGVLLFGGGPSASGVQVQDAQPRGDALMLELGHIFSPRAGRNASYRKTTLEAQDAFTRETFLGALERALTQDGAPLLVYIAAHGEVGQAPAENSVSVWGGERLFVDELVRLLETTRHTRPVRLVMTSCFSGGFAELAFAQGVVGPAATTPRCGLFATPWDLEASGCDPNPDRRAQEGYGLHMLHALQGADRDGEPLSPGALDLNGDGAISLLEAHTRARIASRGIDVPTTTSERWLRSLSLEDEATEPVALPEDEAVIAALSAQLKLATPEAAYAALQELEKAYAAQLESEARLIEEETRAFTRLTGEMLSRWPVIDDPWHPDFATTLTRNRADLEAFLAKAPSVSAFYEATAAVDAAVHLRDAIMAERALVERLTRAHDNRLLAARLKALGGPEWAYYQRLLACERAVP